jgi:hypothetical protein
MDVFGKKAGPRSETDRREWLKSKHKLGTNNAWWIAERAEGRGGDEDSDKRYLAAAAKYVEIVETGGLAKKDRITTASSLKRQPRSTIQ